MANNELQIELYAGIDMVPLGGSFEWTPGPDDDAPIARHDFHLKVQLESTADRRTSTAR